MEKEFTTNEQAIQLLISTFPELKEKWNTYIKENYASRNYQEERLDYIDVGEIVDFIITRFKEGNTKDFDMFFENVERVIVNSDDEVYNFMVVGFLEGLQNVSGWKEINYKKDYSQWLKPATMDAWKGLIKFWGG